jgi:hypothetical protein
MVVFQTAERGELMSEAGLTVCGQDRAIHPIDLRMVHTTGRWHIVMLQLVLEKRSAGAA